MRRLRLPLAGLIVVLSPGFTAYEAFAGGMKTGAGITVPGVQAGSLGGLPQIPTLPGSVIPNVGQGQNFGQAIVLPPVVVPQVGVAPQSGALLPTNVALLPGQTPQNALPTGVLPRLQDTVAAIQKSPDQSQGAIEQLFTGRVNAASVNDPVSGSVGAIDPLVSLSGAEIEAIAADQGKSRAERSSAVKALAKAGDKAALKRVGTGTPATTSDDYEVKREALKALAEQGELVSLPRISREHADQILKDLAGAKKPQAAAFDYDSTLEKSGTPVSQETVEALAKLAKSGVETIVLTDRAPLARRDGDVGMKETFAGADAAQMAQFSVATNRGSQIWVQGMTQTAVSSPKWLLTEQAALEQALMQVREAYPGTSRAVMTDYDAAVFLPEGTPSETVSAAGSLMRRKLADAKVPAVVTVRQNNPGEQSYLSINKYDKSHGVLQLRALREHLGRLRDVERLIPGPLKNLAKRVVSLLPKGAAIPASSVLLVGDHFFGERDIDSAMIKGAPGALAISVGGTADPRLENIFVWPTLGHEASMEVAKAAAGPAPSQMEGLDKKAAVGLFTARSLSITAFLGTTLAYAKLAQQNLASGEFGTVLALGALAAIAAGPLMGRIADKMSPRKGMMINSFLNGMLLLYLPLFSFLGMLSFPTLLVGAIANGFLLSSIMTSEGTYLRRLFGFKNLGTMNSLLQLNYFALQIVFGLLLGIGKLVDGHNLLIPFFIASGVNFLLLPIIRWAMPNTTGAQAAAQASGAPVAAAPAQPQTSMSEKLRSLGAFFKRYWKEAAFFVAAVASFPFLHTALPITLALVHWITRSDGFKMIQADKPIMKAVGLVGMGAFLLYAMQSFMLPTISKVIGGDGASLLYGNMLGSLFLGQMISSSSLAKLPISRLPLIGRFGWQRVIQGGVLAMVATWVFSSLVPGSALAAAAAVALGAAMMWAASKLTDKGWLTYVGVGLSALLLPALFWGVPAMMLAGLVMFGFFLGPATINLFSYIQRRAPQDKIGTIMGIQGSLFNAAISLGIGSMTLIAGIFSPSFPPALWVMAGLGVVAGIIYFLVSRTMPGLSKDAFKKKEELK